MTISVDLSVDGTALIVSHPTGVKYEAQCGGIGCEHPEYEGFVISLGSFMEDFNDCKYGCHHIADLSLDEKMILANDLDMEMQNQTKGWTYSIRFDFIRIDELKEGWWPVIINGIIDSWNKVTGEFKGIIHTGNCD